MRVVFGGIRFFPADISSDHTKVATVAQAF